MHDSVAGRRCQGRVLRPLLLEKVDRGLVIAGRSLDFLHLRFGRNRLRIADPGPNVLIVLLVDLERDVRVAERPDLPFRLIVDRPLAIEPFDML